MGRKSILLTHLKCLCFFYLNIITILFPRICPMSDETRQNRSKRDKMRQDIKLLIIATILQPDNLKIQYLCPFPAIILFLSHPIFPVFFEVIFLQFLRNFSSNECRFRSFTSESQRFLCVLRHLLTRIFPRLFCLFSCQFQIIYRTKKEAKDLWSNASF